MKSIEYENNFFGRKVQKQNKKKSIFSMNGVCHWMHLLVFDYFISKHGLR